MLYSLCNTQKKLMCIDTLSFDNLDYFNDILHLNIRGHTAFAKFLMKKIKF